MEDNHVAKDDIDPDDIDEEIDLDGEDDLDILDDEDDIEDDLVDEDGLDDEDDDDTLGTPVARKGKDDEDDEDDMVAPDDVEEDLAEILKDRLASEDLPAEEDDVQEAEDRSSGEDALQPKRADETLCSSCFMLVRKNAPVCPMGDDECPIVVKKKSKKK
jgi:hypothetical protein